MFDNSSFRHENNIGLILIW